MGKSRHDETTAGLERDSTDGPLVLRVVVDDQVETYDLPEQGAIEIGRGAGVDIPLSHPSVSRRHARLVLGAILRIEDLGSTHGIEVRGRRLTAGRALTVSVGDPIALGSVVIMVQRRAKHVTGQPLEERDLLGPAMQHLYALIDRVAPGNINVLLLGETGVGKEVTATLVHQRSSRAKGPFLGINCGAFAESLLESELFGHERGAFTGAARAKAGLFEAAAGGTVFLDEIGELPASMQVKLLRVFEERRVMRVGATKPIGIDVRFVAATNRDLAKDVAAGRFREDLFFRVNGITLTIPPLRARREEIEPLARSFVARFAKEAGRTPPRLAPEVIDFFSRYAWPGNIRELRNFVERAVLLASDGVITLAHLPAEVVPRAASATAATSERTAEHSERERILAALAETAGNQSRAAKTLGISRRALVNKIIAFGIRRPRG